jgi:hypothetical protein
MTRMPEAATSIEPAGNLLSRPGMLRDFATIVERFPFPEGTTLGVIGKPERPIALGYTPKQLAGVLHRLDDELAKGNDAKLFDKPHWQLASIDALQKISGPLPESVQEAFDAQRALLQEHVTEQRLGPKPFSYAGTHQTQERLEVKDQSVVEKEIRNSLSEAFLEHAREFARIQKNPKVVLAEAIAVATAACGFGGGSIPTPEAPTVTPPAKTEVAPKTIFREQVMDLSLAQDFSKAKPDVSNPASADELLSAVQKTYQESFPPATFPELDINRASVSYFHVVDSKTGQSREMAITSPYAKVATSGQELALLAFRDGDTVKTAHVIYTSNEMIGSVAASTCRIVEIEGNKIIPGNLVFGFTRSIDGNTLVIVANPDDPGQFITMHVGVLYNEKTLGETLGLFQSAAASQDQLDTFPSAVTPSPFIVPTETPVPTDTLVPTETPVPTEAIPNFYHGAAPTLEQFPVVDKSDIPAIIDYLRSQPSVLTPDSPAPKLVHMLKSPTGQGYFTGWCNADGLINCAPAASIQIKDQGIDPHILIWEIRNTDGSRGYLVDYYTDSYQFVMKKTYKGLVDHPGSTFYMQVNTGFETGLQHLYPYAMSLFQQPGYVEALQQWIDTGNIPEALEHLIVSMYTR